MKFKHPLCFFFLKLKERNTSAFDLPHSIQYSLYINSDLRCYSPTPDCHINILVSFLQFCCIYFFSNGVGNKWS